MPYPTSDSEEEAQKKAPKVSDSPDIEVLPVAAGCPKKTDEPEAVTSRF